MNGMTILMNLVTHGNSAHFALHGNVSHLVTLLEAVRTADPNRIHDPGALTALEHDLSTLLKTVRAAQEASK